MRYINPQIQRAADALGYERHLCPHCQGRRCIDRNPSHPCLCLGGYLWYTTRGQGARRERPPSPGKTDEELLTLWARGRAVQNTR